MTPAVHDATSLAALLGVSRRKVLEWARLYGWPHVKIGREVRFTEGHVEQILLRHSVKAKRQNTSGQTSRSRARSGGAA